MQAITDDIKSPSQSVPDPAKLVERLQSLKTRLANMAQTLENSVASATPLKGGTPSDEILYSTPKIVKEFLEGPMCKDNSIFVPVDYVAEDGEQIIEIRYTIPAANQEDVDKIISQLRLNPDIQPKNLEY